MFLFAAMTDDVFVLVADTAEITVDWSWLFIVCCWLLLIVVVVVVVVVCC